MHHFCDSVDWNVWLAATHLSGPSVVVVLTYRLGQARLQATVQIEESASWLHIWSMLATAAGKCSVSLFCLQGVRLCLSLPVDDLHNLMTAPQETSSPAYMDVMPLAPGPDAVQGTAPEADFSQDAAAKYDAVMAFCLSRGQVLFTTLMTEFVNIHLGDLERYS